MKVYMVFLKCLYLAMEMYRSRHEYEPEQWLGGQQSRWDRCQGWLKLGFEMGSSRADLYT